MPSKVKKHNGRLVWQSDESGWESDGFGSRTKSVFLLDDGSLEIQEPLWCVSGLGGKRRLRRGYQPPPASSLMEFMTYEGPPFKGGHHL